MRVLGAGMPERVIDLEHGLAVRPREIQPHALAGRQREPVLHLWGGQLLTFDLAEHDHLQLGLQRRPPRRPRRDHRFHRPCPGSSRLAQPGHGRRLHTEQIRAIEQGPRRARHPDPVLAVDDVDIADQTTLGDHHTRHRRCPPMRNQDVDLAIIGRQPPEPPQHRRGRVCHQRFRVTETCGGHQLHRPQRPAPLTHSTSSHPRKLGELRSASWRRTPAPREVFKTLDSGRLGGSGRRLAGSGHAPDDVRIRPASPVGRA